MESRYIKNFTYGQSNKRNWEKIIAQLYCLSLPFRMFSQLSFLKSIFGVSANYLPFVFHLLGVFLWFGNYGWRLDFGDKKDLAFSAIKLTVWLNISSVLMAAVIQMIYGNHGSENAFQGIMGMLVYFTQYLFMFLYNYRVFSLLSVREINKLLHIDCLVLLLIGYMQFFVLNGVGVGIYDRINIFGVLNSSKHLGKLPLTGIEGATAGCLIGVFVFPFLFSNILYGKRQYIFELLLWGIPLFLTNSTTAYILATTNLVVFVLLAMLKSDNPIKGFITLTVILCISAILVYLLINSGILDKEGIEKIRYLLLEKATDENNQSTAIRTIPLYMNWGAFSEFPILGVGNGLQGYFYEKYMPEWAYKSGGTYTREYLALSKESISNGSVFIPSLLSGYGIVGCIFIAFFVGLCYKNNKKDRNYSQNLYYVYILSGLAFFIMGFQGDAYGLYFAWFMLSIPFMSTNTKKEVPT